MNVDEWRFVIDQLADMGTRDVQFIGGEPTLHPGLEELIAHAYASGLRIEVFSNLVHIRQSLWDAFQRYGVKLATSYYSDTPAEHDALTRLKGSHKKTRGNIQKAIDLGMPIRGGVVTVNPGQRVIQAAQDLTDLGVDHVGGDKLRAFGRASQGAAPKIADIATEHGRGPAEACTPPQFLPSCGPCGPCVPSVGVCDPREASAGPAATTIGAPQ